VNRPASYTGVLSRAIWFAITQTNRVPGGNQKKAPFAGQKTANGDHFSECHTCCKIPTADQYVARIKIKGKIICHGAGNRGAGQISSGTLFCRINAAFRLASDRGIYATAKNSVVRTATGSISLQPSECCL
jgi:hypothetical protein